MSKFSPADALREHLLLGNRVTLLEAILLFGVQAPNAEFGRLKKAGFIVKSEPVPMARVLRRINEVSVCKPPSQLPFKEITLREYWISQ